MSLGRHFTYNLLGFFVPTALALVTVPAYLHLIGTERYGVLAIAWLILGYFGLFDLGLGRATTQRIASLEHASAHQRAVALDTALATNIGIGLVGGAILWPVSWYVFKYVIELSPALRAEAVGTAPLLGIAVPIATTMGVLSGALMGRKLFLEVNRISITSTALFQLLPLLVAWLWSPSLPLLLIASIFARAVGLVFLWIACRSEFGSVDGRMWDRHQLKGLLSYGGWVTLTSLVGPLLAFSDRIFIGSLINAVAVTIYTVPMEATRRLSGIASALANALFPRLASAKHDEAERLSSSAVGALYAMTTPIVSMAVILMDPAMRLWLGQDVGSRSAPLARLFVISWWLNLFAQVPFTRLQAQGRPDVVSKLLLAETPVYLLCVWWGIQAFGLLGAVLAFLVRIAADTLLMFKFAAGKFQHGWWVMGTFMAFVGTTGFLNDRPPLSTLAALFYGLTAFLVSGVPSLWLVPPELRAKALRTCTRAFNQLRRTTARWRSDARSDASTS